MHVPSLFALCYRITDSAACSPHPPSPCVFSRHTRTRMTTVGYGDISPNSGVGEGNANEMVVAMLSMLFGTTM